MRCLIKRVLLYLFLSICVEVFIFNHKALFSFNSDEITVSSYQVGDGLEKIEDRRYFVQGKDNVFIELSNVNEKIKFAYFDIKCFDSQNRMIPTKIGISLKDEGHSKYYSLPQISSYGTVEKSKYVRVHGYGKVDSIFLNLSDSGATYIEIGQISLNTVVPFEFSTKRVLLFMTLFFILWMIRPTSQLYNYHFNEVKHKKSWVLAVLVVNIMALFILVRLNTAFIEPQWEHHSQYAQLAVALSEGRTNIDVDFDDIDTLNALDNPYDFTQRDGIDKIQNVWDTAYYKGNFYVYFGIVPVLVFDLPFFLITGGAFPTWAAVFLVGVWCLVATFCFIDRYFYCFWRINF